MRAPCAPGFRRLTAPRPLALWSFCLGIVLAGPAAAQTAIRTSTLADGGHRVASREDERAAVVRERATPAARERQSAGRVVGVVRDAETGAPLAGAQVAVRGLPLGNVADASGSYFVNRVPAGTQTLVVEYLGYATGAPTLRVAADAENRLDVALAPSPLAMQEVLVEEDGVGDLTAYVDATPEPRLPPPALRPMEIQEPDTTLMVAWRRAMRHLFLLHVIDYPATGVRAYYRRAAPTRREGLVEPTPIAPPDSLSSRPPASRSLER